MKFSQTCVQEVTRKVSLQSIPKGAKKSRHRDDNQSTDEENGSDVDRDDDSEEEMDQMAEVAEDNNEPDLDDDEDWIKFQEETKRDNSLETKSKETFPVHCPYYPGVRSFCCATFQLGGFEACLCVVSTTGQELLFVAGEI